MRHMEGVHYFSNKNSVNNTYYENYFAKKQENKTISN